MRKCPQALFLEEEEEEQQEQLQKMMMQEQHKTGASSSDATASSSTDNNDAAGVNSHDDNQNEDDENPNDTMHEHHHQHLSHPQTPVTPLTPSFSLSNMRYSRYMEFNICPEVGLSKQEFKCADCQTPVLLNNSRLDDYDGLYYCYQCHWGDLEKIPARILHNWDPTPKPVSRKSLQMICYIKRKPVLFDIINFNPMLYGLVEDLPLIKVRG